MSDSKGPWTTKNDDEVDFDLPLFQYPQHEGDSMIPSTSTPKNFSTSTTPELPSLEPPRPNKSTYIQGPLTHEASSSAPTDLTFSLPANGGGGGGNGGTFIPRSQRTTVSSIKSFASSPLKPTGPGSMTFPLSPFNRSGSRGSAHVNRIASEECRALASHSMNHSGSRGSMILYRCADPATATEEGLIPPSRSHLQRDSILSLSADSIVSLSSDSKYPTRTIGSDRGLIAYAYDPSMDELGGPSSQPAEDDYLHDPDFDSSKSPHHPHSTTSGFFFPAVSFRGVINILALVALIAAILCLFVVYPVVRFYHDSGRNLLITLNTRINSTGQADFVVVGSRSQILFAAPIPLIDSSTPLPARILKSAQDIIYELVFSDEFDRLQNGRSSSNTHSIWEVGSSSRRSRSGLRRRRDDRERLWTALEMKLPLCLGLGGFVEVGLREKRVRVDSRPWSRSRKGGEEEKEEEGGSLKRLIYWPDNSDDSSWSSLSQDELVNIPNGVLSSLTFDSDSSGRSSSLTLSIDDSGRRNLKMGERTVTEVVDYVRIYQPIKPSLISGDEEEPTKWECVAMRDEYVMLEI